MIGSVSCSGFLDTAPRNQLSPQTTWKTADDAEKFLVGCYDGWEDGGTLLYMDCLSDFGYSFHGLSCRIARSSSHTDINGREQIEASNVGWAVNTP